MTFQTKAGMLVFSLLLLFVSSCSTGSTTDLFPAEASQALENVRQRVQEQAGVDLEDIQITDVKRVAWANACLELPEPGEACAQVITSGWRINARLDPIDEHIVVHTDETGSQIRMAGLSVGELAPLAVLEAQRFLSDELDVPVEQVRLVSSEQVVWSDSCLGLGGIAESCLAEGTPGWRNVFKVAGEQYELRTDEDGAEMRLAE